MRYQEIGPSLLSDDLKKHNNNYKAISADIDNLNGKVENAIEEVSTAAFNQVVDAAKLNWKEPVSSVTDLTTTYPTAAAGDASMARDTGKVYRYDGADWGEIQQIDAGPVNEVDARLTEQLAQTSKENIFPDGLATYTKKSVSAQAEYIGIEMGHILKDYVAKTITISFDLKTAVAGEVKVYTLGRYGIGDHFFQATNQYQRFSFTTVITDRATSSDDLTQLSFYGLEYGNGVIPNITRVKVEENPIETTWTPSPTDTEKIRGRKSITDFYYLVEHKGQTNEDWSQALQAALDFVKSKPTPQTLLFPSDVYQYSISPNWAVTNLNVETEGEVRLRYTGTGHAVIIDAGEVTGTAFDVNFGYFLIEAPNTAKNALFVRGVHASKIKAKVLGAGATYAGLRVEWCVCTEFDVIVSNNHGGWYQNAKPKYGYYIDKKALQPEGQGGYTSWCKFNNPIAEGCEIGIYLDRAQGNSFYSGTSEGHSDKGIHLTANAIWNKFFSMDLEVNENYDIYCLGKENEFYSLDTTNHNFFGGFAINNVMTGGSHNSIEFESTTYGNMLQNVKYNRSNNGALISDPGGRNRLMSNRNVGLNRTENRPPSSAAITVGASPFTYVNQSGNDELINIMGGTISSFLYVHGGYGDSTTTIPQFIRICPGDSIRVTYSVAPTMRKYTT